MYVIEDSEVEKKKETQAIRLAGGLIWGEFAFRLLAAVSLFALFSAGTAHLEFADRAGALAVLGGSCVAYAVLAVLLMTRPSERTGWTVLVLHGILLGVDVNFIQLVMETLFRSAGAPPEPGDPVVGMAVGLVLAIGIPIGIALYRATQAYARARVRVTDPSEASASVKYCQVLTQLMVRIMNADGEMNPKEAAYYDKVLDAWKLSKFEKKVLLDEADMSVERLEDLAKQAIQTGQHVQLDDPATQLVTMLVGAAKSDGAPVPEEMALVERAARAVGMDQTRYQELLTA
ncbi:MAG: TerB family tellurite resistance protein [Deltaproteobacteria bacterium]|nr:TerB family tellurite resistance protein [Deltaproteobacteria bacterium]